MTRTSGIHGGTSQRFGGRAAPLVRLLLAGCTTPCLAAGCGEEPTEIVVEVTSDLRVPGDMDRITFRLEDDAAPLAEVDALEATFPLRWVVTSRGETQSAAIVVAALRGEETVIEQTALVRFAPEKTLTARFRLARVCIAIPCGAGETCRESRLGTAECASVFESREDDADGGAVQ